MSGGDERWLPAPACPKPDEPISYEDWQLREKRREITAARLALCARGVHPGPDPMAQLAKLEIIDIVTGQGVIDDGRCPDLED